MRLVYKEIQVGDVLWKVDGCYAVPHEVLERSGGKLKIKDNRGNKPWWDSVKHLNFCYYRTEKEALRANMQAYRELVKEYQQYVGVVRKRLSELRRTVK